MPMRSTECFEWLDSSRITTPAESGKSATFINKRGERVLLVHADRCCRKGRVGCIDCFFEANQKVADFIVCKPGIVDVIVELKGVNVLEAVQQIKETERVWYLHSQCGGRIGALIVSSKGGSSPRARSHFLNEQAKFKQRGITLKHVAAPRPEFKFSEFIRAKTDE